MPGDMIGAFAGVSGRTVDKIRDVVEAAAAEPEKFGHLVEEMDRTGKSCYEFPMRPLMRELFRISR